MDTGIFYTQNIRNNEEGITMDDDLSKVSCPVCVSIGDWDQQLLQCASLVELSPQKGFYIVWF